MIKVIMCMIGIGGPLDGQVNCEVKEMPDEKRTQWEFFCTHLLSLDNLHERPVYCEEFDPTEDYGRVVIFEKDSDIGGVE